MVYDGNSNVLNDEMTGQITVIQTCRTLFTTSHDVSPLMIHKQEG
jgi:hypothetical protein